METLQSAKENKGIILNIINYIHHITVTQRKTVLVITDILLIQFSMLFSLFLKYSTSIPEDMVGKYIAYTLIISSIMLFSFYINNLYSSLWRFASIEELLLVIKSCLLGTAFVFLILQLSPLTNDLTLNLIFLITIMGAVGGSRFSYRLIRRALLTVRKDCEITRVMIIGAGEAGAVLIKELRHSNEIHKNPVAIIDDNICKKKCLIHGVPVVGTRNDIVKMANELKIEEIIIGNTIGKEK